MYLKAAFGDLYVLQSDAAVTDENGVATFWVKALHEGVEIFTFTTVLSLITIPALIAIYGMI